MTPLLNKTHYSLREAISKPEEVVKRCQELGLKSCAITDTNSISGAVTFSNLMNKADLKPIIGTSLRLGTGMFTLIAKNYDGWLDLVELVSKAYEKDGDPYISIEEYGERKNLILIDGHQNSPLKHLSLLNDSNKISYHIDTFKGLSDYYIGIQSVLGNIEQMREIAKSNNIKTLALANPHYPTEKESFQHRMVLCTSLKTTLPKINKDLASNIPVENELFFRQNNSFIPNTQNLLDWGNTEEEIDNTELVNSMCEAYKIGGDPQLPTFPCPTGMSQLDYLQQLCLEGWHKRNKNWGEDYVNRIKTELDTINSYPILATYFLIVQDYVKFAKSQGILVGPGRGSGGGCLTSYLLQINEVNPMPYHLLFERFYNAGRNTPGKVSLPDIDVDFPPDKRELIINYIENFYGKDHVAHMATFGRLQGRSAIRETLRVNDACPLDEINKISKLLPQEFEIADDLESAGETSIIKYTLENLPNVLKDYCRLSDDGKLEGDLSEYFEQAIKLEGVYLNQGKHASGIVIAPKPINQIAPMVKDASGNIIVGFDMEDAEACGLVKFDILGLSLLSKLQGVKNLLKTGKIYG
jgi:DNA polymerase-3 subunit alpha